MSVLVYTPDHQDLQLLIATFGRLYESTFGAATPVHVDACVRTLREHADEFTVGYEISSLNSHVGVAFFVFGGTIIVHVDDFAAEELAAVVDITDYEVTPGGSVYDVLGQLDVKCRTFQADFAPHQYFEAAEFAMYVIAKESLPPVSKWLTDDIDLSQIMPGILGN